MAERSLSSTERGWLDYLNDIGFQDVYLEPRDSPRAVEEARVENLSVAAVADEPVIAPAPKTPSPPVPVAQEKLEPVSGSALEALASLQGEAAGCTACGLSEGRNSVVFGSGNPQARLMFIGEGPGAEEDRQGLPFVGPAGDKLTQIIKAIDLERKDVYIANVVKCRPPRNRDPEAEEVAACRGYLERQIELVGPQVIVALGRVAAQTLLGLDSTLGRMRGSWHEVQGVPTRVTYHPAALLRNASYRRPTWEDMQIVRDRLAEAS